MHSVLQDLRFGLRSLMKHRGFTLVAVITLALGVGANSTIFSVINATLMKPVNVSQPDRLVYVFNGTPGTIFSYPDYSELRDQNKSFDGLMAWGGITASLNSNDRTDLVSGAIVTGNYFQVLGIGASPGRIITPDDDRIPGAHLVAMISYGLWQRRFGGDQTIVGKQILLNGNNFTIVGVAPKDFSGAEFGIVRDVYVPMMMQSIMRPPRGGYSGEMDPDLLKKRSNRWLFAIGRMKPGVSVEQAQADLALIASQQAAAYPETNRSRTVQVLAFNQTDNPQQQQQLVSVARLLMSVVGLVLLIACANIANLLLARGSARGKEIAVRLAIGATRWRIMRQLLTESVLLAACGGVLGLLLTWWATSSFRAMPPPAGALPLAPQFAIDLRVLLFTSVLALVAGIIFGMAPALRISRPEIVPALKDDSWSSRDRRSYFNLRNLLVVMQVALSTVLLIAAGLFLRSLRFAQSIDPGFDSERIVTVPLNINLLRYTKPQGRDFYRHVVESVQGVPGVEAASLARNLPLGGGSSVRSLLIERREGPDNDSRSEGAGSAGNDPNSVNVNVVGPKYFQTMGIPLLRGRDFSFQDTEDKPGVVVVNESFANRHLPGQEVLGRRISFNGTKGPWKEIVGVVRDSKYIALSEPPTPFVFLPLQQNHETGMTLITRATRNPSSLVAAVRNEVQNIDKNLPISNPMPMSEWIVNSLYAARMGATLLGIFAALALSLASIGLYGVMSFAVSQRTRELGIRMALGARPTDVFKLVLQQGFGLIMSGVVVGLIVSLAVSKLLVTFLYGIRATDGITFVVIPIVLTIVAGIACYIPARRATKVDPLVALRYE
jgi:putative ABC transport system permease protein